jgi:hypothetical protein
MHRNSQKRQREATRFLAGPIEIDLAIEPRRAAADLARPPLRADRSEVDVSCHQMGERKFAKPIRGSESLMPS